MLLVITQIFLDLKNIKNLTLSLAFLNLKTNFLAFLALRNHNFSLYIYKNF